MKWSAQPCLNCGWLPLTSSERPDGWRTSYVKKWGYLCGAACISMYHAWEQRQGRLFT